MFNNSFSKNEICEQCTYIDTNDVETAKLWFNLTHYIPMTSYLLLICIISNDIIEMLGCFW